MCENFYEIQVDQADILQEVAAAIVITKAVIENGDAHVTDEKKRLSVDEGDPRYAAVTDTDTAQPDDEPTDTTDVAPLVSSSRDEVDGDTEKEADDGDAAKDAEDIVAAIEGAVNVGFEADSDEKVQISTQL